MEQHQIASISESSTPKKSVAILMATYNGEKYLAQQIDSILDQTCKDWTLYVQDDLSTDHTMDVLLSYAARDSRVQIVENNEKHGARDNFMSLLLRVSADYYMLSDQDDVWFPKKVELLLQRIQKVEASADHQVPVLIASDLTVVDENLQELAPSLWEQFCTAPALIHTLDMLGVHNSVTGCTTIFNEGVKQAALPIPPQAVMHDWWLALATLKAGGRLDYLEQSVGLYRQHGRNVLGSEDLQHHHLAKRLCYLGKTLRQNVELFRMIRQAGYGNVFTFLKNKVVYYRRYSAYRQQQAEVSGSGTKTQEEKQL